MKIFLYIGPHKTGSTAIEHCLLRTVKNKKANFFFPPAYESTPGSPHAPYAWEFLGLVGHKQNPKVLYDLIEKGKTSGYDQMIIATEDFCRVEESDTGFDAFFELGHSVDYEIITTLTPLSQRLRASVAEGIRENCIYKEVYSEHELLHLLTQGFGLKSNFLSNVLNRMNQKKTHVVLVDKSKPDVLWKSFSQILQCEIEPDKQLTNKRDTYAQTIMRNELNKLLPQKDPIVMRKIASSIFSTVKKQFPEVADIPFPELPYYIQRLADDIWQGQLMYLENMASTDKVTIYSSDTVK